MIEGRVRELVAEMTAASDGWSPRERIDAIAELEAAVGMLQAVSNVEAVAYVEQRRAADKAARTGADTAGIAGRGAPVEIAMARGVSRATVDYQLAFARQLVDHHPALLAACLDGQVCQSAAKHIVAATEPLTPDQRLAIDGELAELACELTPGEVRKPHVGRSPPPTRRPLSGGRRRPGRVRRCGR